LTQLLWFTNKHNWGGTTIPISTISLAPSFNVNNAINDPYFDGLWHCFGHMADFSGDFRHQNQPPCVASEDSTMAADQMVAVTGEWANYYPAVAWF